MHSIYIKRYFHLLSQLTDLYWSIQGTIADLPMEDDSVRRSSRKDAGMCIYAN